MYQLVIINFDNSRMHGTNVKIAISLQYLPRKSLFYYVLLVVEHKCH